jgi:LuxR family quorum sensing-dependent transcriptional regulator
MNVRLVTKEAVTPSADLNAALSDFANGIENLKTPEEVLDALHALSTTSLPLNVLGASRLPLVGNWVSELGKSAFLHRSVPAGWWEEYSALRTQRFKPLSFLARSSLASYTWTETWRLVQPIGVDRWSQELSLKFGMRDGLTCPVGGRWVVAFWSPKDLSNLVTQPVRIVVSAAASFAVLRLEQLLGPDVDRLPTRPQLTPRELAVLRLTSMGGQTAEIAQELGIGEETIRSHLKKAQTKLEARNRTHAACEALRRQLVP